MTKTDEIETMEEGRYMDGQVGEALFSFTKVQRTYSGNIAGYRADGWGWQTLPHYSTDIADAMEVLGWLRMHFFDTQIMFHDYTDDVTVFLEPRKGHDEIKPCILAKGDTLPLAICRAALLATL